TVWALVGEAVADGSAVLVATHYLHEAEAVATRVVGLAGGRVVADGSVSELRRRAGGSVIRFRTPAPMLELRGFRRDPDGPVTAVSHEPERLLAELVHAGVELQGLEVRPLSLEEALREDGWG